MKNNFLQFFYEYAVNVTATFLLVFVSLFAHSQCCTYTLVMHDSYGDGWNGGFLNVSINHVSIGNFSGTGFSSYVTFQVCQGDSLELFYTASMYENENTYQLYDPSWNYIFSDGPNPKADSLFTLIGDCHGTVEPGSNPCTAMPINIGECTVADNTGYQGSGLNPGCAEFHGADMWFSFQVPASGNVQIATDSGAINDTGLAVWADNICTNIRELSCDDDAGEGSFSLVNLYDLTPAQTLYIQVWGYGGGTGTFRLCTKDLGRVSLDSSELPIVMINRLGNTIIQDTKVDALMDIKYNGPGKITHLTDASNVYTGHIGIEIRGASSAGYPQTPYGFETRTPTGSNNDVSLLGMPVESDWVLISNYNDRSFIRNTLAYSLFGEMGDYSPRTRLCEVLVDSSYKGIYVLSEKIKRDKNRVNISKLNSSDNSGDKLTGGYILQQNYWDANTSFLSNYSPIDHPGFDVHFVYEYPKPDSITSSQKTYIASFVDSLETALYSPDFANPVKGYRKYLNEKSFIDYFLLNELSRNNDGFKKSVFFYKDRNSKGGKMKAGPVWDFDWAWKNLYGCFVFENLDGSGWAHLINDCPTDNYSCGWYIRLLQDTTFTNDLRCSYEEYRQTILDTTHIFAYIDSVRDLVQNAQARHFQRWQILGISGPAPEVGAVANTYNGELDTLKRWIILRLNWLDANIPGLCGTVGVGNEPQNELNPIRYYPNPGSGLIHFEGLLPGIVTVQWSLYDVAGKKIDSKVLQSGTIAFDYTIKEKGVYFFTISKPGGIIQYGKLVVI